MRKLIKNILKESEDEFNWVGEVTSDYIPRVGDILTFPGTKGDDIFLKILKVENCGNEPIVNKMSSEVLGTDVEYVHEKCNIEFIGGYSASGPWISRPNTMDIGWLKTLILKNVLTLIRNPN